MNENLWISIKISLTFVFQNWFRYTDRQTAEECASNLPPFVVRGIISGDTGEEQDPHPCTYERKSQVYWINVACVLTTRDLGHGFFGKQPMYLLEAKIEISKTCYWQDIEDETKWSTFCRRHRINFRTKIVVFRFKFKFYRNFFPGDKLTIIQYWFRKWLGTKQATIP